MTACDPADTSAAPVIETGTEVGTLDGEADTATPICVVSSTIRAKQLRYMGFTCVTVTQASPNPPEFRMMQARPAELLRITRATVAL